MFSYRFWNFFLPAYFFLLIILIPIALLSTEPWANKKSNHPRTMDVTYGESKGFLYSGGRYFVKGKNYRKSIYPFDMVIHFYKNHITKLNGTTCRYYPTCSGYSLEAMNRFGILPGLVMAAERLMRCHEYQNDDLYDPVVLW